MKNSLIFRFPFKISLQVPGKLNPPRVSTILLKDLLKTISISLSMPHYRLKSAEFFYSAYHRYNLHFIIFYQSFAVLCRGDLDNSINVIVEATNDSYAQIKKKFSRLL